MTTARELARRQAILTPATLKRDALFEASLAMWRWRLREVGAHCVDGRVPLGARVHDLKTHPPYYEALDRRTKTFEVRKNDRRFKVGEGLLLREWDPKTRRHTGREQRRLISYVLKGGKFGVEAGYVVMGLS